MTEVVKAHWITGLSLIAAAFLLATGVAMVATGGEFDETGVRVLGGFGLTGGLALLGGLWAVRTGRADPRVAHGLIVAGLLVLAVGYWWFVFVPPVVAVAVLYAGVLRHGLERELAIT